MCQPNLHFLCVMREKRDSTFNRFWDLRVNGGRRTADGGRRTADGGRRTADGGRRTADGGRRTADGGRRTADGEWRHIFIGPLVQRIKRSSKDKYFQLCPENGCDVCISLLYFRSERTCQLACMYIWVNCQLACMNIWINFRVWFLPEETSASRLKNPVER